MKLAPWVVNIKGDAGLPGFEITVLRDDNDGGKRSYGWMGANKKLIASGGGPCNYLVSQFVWDRHVETARLYAEHLNAQEEKA